MQELSLLGISHIVFGIVLISAKKKERSDYILIFWLLILLMPFLERFLQNAEYGSSGILRFNNPAFTLLNGPFLYLYMKEVTKREMSSFSYWPHFVIFSLFYIYLVFHPAAMKPGGPAEHLADAPLVIRYFGEISLVLFFLYASLSFLYLQRYRKEIKETYAYQNKEINLIWLSLLPCLFLTLLFIIVLFENTLLGSSADVEVLHLSLFYFFTLYLIFFGLRQTKVYPVTDGLEKLSGGVKHNETDENTSLQLEKIRKVIEDGKLYLNPVLSVYDLAKAAGISRHRISTLLNENLSMNFFYFVNEYRLNEVCRRLKKDAECKFNLLEHALDSGFNSKSSFNSLFKKRYDLTPSQYRKKIKTENTI